MKDFWKSAWPWIKEASIIVGKHWRPTIGSLFALFTAWLYIVGKIDFQTAAGALTILWIGGYVNRRLDFSVIGKIFKDSKETPKDDEQN